MRDAPRHGGFSEEDIGSGFGLVKEDTDAVREELLGMGEHLRFQGLSGNDRKEFLSSMTEDEFKRLKVLADSLDVMGYTGNHALEQIVMEVAKMDDEEPDSA